MKCYLMTQKLLELLLFSNVMTVLNKDTWHQYDCFHAFPKYLNILRLIVSKIPSSNQIFDRKSLVFQVDHSAGHSIIQIIFKYTFFL